MCARAPVAAGAPGNRARNAAGAGLPIAVTEFENNQKDPTMMRSGYVAIYRATFEHAVLTTPAERYAWIWMIAHVEWKPRTVTVDRKSLLLARGQMLHSERFLADSWGMTRAKVRSFLNRLAASGMVNHQSNHLGSLVTICNYNDFQVGDEVEKPPIQPTLNKKKDNKKKKKDSIAREGASESEFADGDAQVIDLAARRKPKAPSDWRKDEQFYRWYQAYPRKVAPMSAHKAYRRVIDAGAASEQQLLIGAQRYATSGREVRFTKHPQTWLNGGCWHDEDASREGGYNHPDAF